MNAERWRELLAALRLPDDRAMYSRLLSAYGESHRAYHTAAHIDACLRELDGAKALARAAAEIELALWFHDAIYDPRGSDNEARCAEWACQWLSEVGGSNELKQTIRSHILATAHRAEPEDEDARLLVDIDLSILGQPPGIYDAFERAVRVEYQFVPPAQFAAGRTAVLRSFLEREYIYATPAFRDRYEERARQNLEQAIAELAAKIGAP